MEKTSKQVYVTLTLDKADFKTKAIKKNKVGH